MKKITAIAIAIMMTVTMVTSTAALDSSSADLQNEPAAPGISSVSEIENAPAENLALYGTVIVDSVSTDYPDSVANNANDGDYFTDWRSNSVGRDGDDAWIGIKFEEPTAIAKLKIVWGDAYPLEGGYRVEVSQDGEEWTEASFAAERSSNELTESFDDNIELVGSYTVKCVRVVCYNSNDKGYPIVCEFEVYGESYRFPVSITQQPTETIVPVGSTASTSVAAIGDGLTYQWYYKNPGKTTFMKSSVTEPEYSYTMTEAKSGRQVYCVVTDMCGNSVTTDTVVLRAKTLWDYTVNYDGRAIITKYSGNESHVVVPSVIDGFPVWKIGERAFSANQDIISVDISYGITWIDICAFGFCYNLKSVNIPDSIIFIRNNAFYQCYSLENVDVPASVVDIGSTVFCDCTSLKVITIRGDLIGIGTGVFDNVTANVNYPKEYNWPDRIKQNYKTIKWVPYGEGDLIITEHPVDTEAKLGSVISVSADAVGKGLKYQWYVKDVGEKEFKKSSVTKPTYSYTMTNAKSGRQVYCIITDKDGNYVKTNTAVLRKENEWDYIVKTDKAIISGYTGKEENIVIPSSIDGYPVVAIGSEAFKSNQNITSVVIPKGVVRIEDGAFRYCYYIESVKLPEGLVSIREEAFYVCRNLVDIDFPASLTRIDARAFEGCINLDIITFRGGQPKLGVGAFNYVTAVANYPADKGWQSDVMKEYSEIDWNAYKEGSVVLPEDLNDAQVNMGSKISVKVSAEGDGLTYQWYVKNPGKKEFVKSSVTKDTYSYTMTIAKSGRQVYCVVTDKYGNSVTTKTVLLKGNREWQYTISDDKATVTGYTGTDKDLVIPSVVDGFPVVAVGRMAFRNCTELTSVVIPDGVTLIGEMAFEGCIGLTTITISKDIEMLDYCAFYSCGGIETVIFRGDAPDFEDSCFDDGFKANIYYPEGYDWAWTVETYNYNWIQYKLLELTSQPENVEAKSGAKISASVKATGEGLTYQWYVKEKGESEFKLSSVTKSTYSYTMTYAKSGRQVYCVVTDKFGNTVTSDTVTLKIK